MAAATINGQSVPLSYELQNGDVVSIITSEEKSAGRPGGAGAIAGDKRPIGGAAVGQPVGRGGSGGGSGGSSSSSSSSSSGSSGSSGSTSPNTKGAIMQNPNNNKAIADSNRAR